VKLRAVVAMMEHETNTFSPVPTPLRRFGGPEVPRGSEAYRLFKGTGTGFGGFLDLADEAGMEIVTPIAGTRASAARMIRRRVRYAREPNMEQLVAGCWLLVLVLVACADFLGLCPLPSALCPLLCPLPFLKRVA